jgi:hypothetical protein
VEQRFSLERIGTELRDFMVGQASCGRRLGGGFTPSL